MQIRSCSAHAARAGPRTPRTTTTPGSCRAPEQGWNLLCNAVVVFDDTGELLPDGRVVAPHRPGRVSA
jgi:hypothetical protein